MQRGKGIHARADMRYELGTAEVCVCCLLLVLWAPPEFRAREGKWQGRRRSDKHKPVKLVYNQSQGKQGLCSGAERSRGKTGGRVQVSSVCPDCSTARRASKKRIMEFLRFETGGGLVRK